jgi:hypothetical protein
VFGRCSPRTGKKSSTEGGGCLGRPSPNPEGVGISANWLGLPRLFSAPSEPIQLLPQPFDLPFLALHIDLVFRPDFRRLFLDRFQPAAELSVFLLDGFGLPLKSM